MRWAIISLIVLLSFFSGSFFYAGRFDLPPKTQTYLDRNGAVIGTLNPSQGGFQIWKPLAEIPEKIIDETIRREDRFFFWHPGINPVSVAKSALANLSKGRIVRGGSTITQQLARTLIQEKEGKRLNRSYFNKVREGIVAVGLELRHSKRWILERYLNSIYYGNRCYGIASAGEFYFGIGLSDLSAGEVSFLVSLPRAPAVIARNGVTKQSRWKSSRVIPLDRHAPSGLAMTPARHFLEMAARRSPREQVVRTSLDLELQTKVGGIVSKITSDWSTTDEKVNSAVVVLDVPSGDLLALAGSRNFFDPVIDGQFNSATALRQPGSALKPFVYFAAFAKGFRPDSRLFDVPSSFASLANEEGEGYMPQNFDRRFHGAVTIREALANSYNVPAVATLDEVGLSTYHEILRGFGFSSLKKAPNHYGLAVALGAGEVSLLELTNAYAALARGGRFVPSTVIARSTPGHGEPVESMPRGSSDAVRQAHRVQSGARDDTQVIPNASLYASMITDILSDPEARLKTFGANEDLGIDGHQVAVKTGTSYERRDHWTVGYTPRYAVGVWIGHPDSSPLPNDKKIAASPIWHAVMEQLLRGERPESFPDHRTADGRLERGGDRPFLARNDFPWQIVSPLSRTRFRKNPAVPSKHQNIAAEVARGEGETIPDLSWYLDGELFERTEGTESRKIRIWLPSEVGWHKLAVESKEGGRQVVSFQVMGEES